jgi:hypothetical protein
MGSMTDDRAVFHDVENGSMTTGLWCSLMNTKFDAARITSAKTTAGDENYIRYVFYHENLDYLMRERVKNSASRTRRRPTPTTSFSPSRSRRCDRATSAGS